jgi:hypothetical protein
MKTTMTKTDKQEALRREIAERFPAEKTRWQTAMLPRLHGGKAQPGEWRPGESAGRGYERVVSDWWWI